MSHINIVGDRIQNLVLLLLEAISEIKEPDPASDGKSPPEQFPEILAYSSEALSVPKSETSTKLMYTSSNPCYAKKLICCDVKIIKLTYLAVEFN